MAKTIQVCVDDSVKDSADSLFMSLGLDTSTAIRMFLAEALKAGCIPFAVTNSEDDNTAIRDAIAYRKAGGKFHTASEFKARMKTAIKECADVRA
jgi:DNA-damage-inducible protein J